LARREPEWRKIIPFWCILIGNSEILYWFFHTDDSKKQSISIHIEAHVQCDKEASILIETTVSLII